MTFWLPNDYFFRHMHWTSIKSVKFLAHCSLKVSLETGGVSSKCMNLDRPKELRQLKSDHLIASLKEKEEKAHRGEGEDTYIHSYETGTTPTGDSVFLLQS